MNKKKLIKEVARRTGLSIRVSKVVVDCLINNIVSVLCCGDRVTLNKFGAFYSAERQSRTYYDINSGIVKSYSKKKVSKFVPYKSFKEQLQTKILDIHTGDDGSIGNNVVMVKQIYSAPTHYTKAKQRRGTNTKPTSCKFNIGKRVVRKSAEGWHKSA